MKLLKIYESILKFAGLEVDEQGYISIVAEDLRNPALVNGLRLVMPTNEQLRTFNPQEKIVFHPMTEDTQKGESDVIQKLRHYINIRLNCSVGIVALALLKILTSPAYHEKLSPEQAELLLAIKDADEKTAINFTNLLLAGIKDKPDRIFVNIFLRRGPTLAGKKYSRGGIVSFPFYEELKAGKMDKMRVKDKEAYRLLMEFMFPGLDNPDNYNYGSNSRTAPFLDALMHTAAIISSRLNDLLDIYGEYIDEADQLVYDSDWWEAFENLESLSAEIRQIPVQRGNEGSSSIFEDRNIQEPAVSAPVYAPTSVQVRQPAQQVPVKPEVITTPNGLDFRSMVATTPALAYAQNPLAPVVQQQYYQQQQPVRREPSWAPSPQQPYYGPQQYPQQSTIYPMQQQLQYGQQPYPQQQNQPINYGYNQSTGNYPIATSRPNQNWSGRF